MNEAPTPANEGSNNFIGSVDAATTANAANSGEPTAAAAPIDAGDDWTSAVVLGDGSTVTLRPIRPDDAASLQAFHARQSDESKYFRYFSPKPQLSDSEAERFTHVDMVDRVALVVEDHGELIAWASYERWKGRPDAEVAFQVDDHHKGKGIATLLLEHLASIALSNGITAFTAETLADNRGMISVFSKAGWPLQRRFDSGVVDVDFPLDDSAEFQDSVERREQRADSRAVARLLLPRSIAIVGASDEAGSIGADLWANTTRGHRIPCFPVNPGRATVGGSPAFARVSDIPGEVDLAVIAAPEAALPAIIDDCIAKRVRGAILVTTPLDADTDLQGLIEHARRNGLRIIGPSSMGVASPLPDVAINAALVNVALPPGKIAISTQSGTLGSSVLRLAGELGIGLSWFVSLGDKGDVSSNDLIQFWDDDAATSVICLYTESVGNPRKFTRIARRVARKRPIIVVRTGAALAGLANDAMYRNSGVIEVPSVQSMLDTARVMADQPPINGDRVTVISNARSPRIAAEVVLAAAGLDVVEPPRQLDFRATPDDYRDALTQVKLAEIDAVIVIYAPPTEHAVGEPSEAIAATMADGSVAVTAVMLGVGDGRLTATSNVSSFAFPEQAAVTLARLRAYSRWSAAEAESSPNGDDLVGIDRHGANELLTAELDRLEHPDDPEHPAAGLARPETVHDVLGMYGIEMPTTRLVRAPDAVAAADAMGYPVAVKALGREAGTSIRAGVGLDLADAADVAAAVTEMQDSLGDGADQVWVQRMAEPGYELRARAVVDDRYGPLITTGLGGYDADLIGDVASRVAPLSPSAARQLFAETRAAAALADDDEQAMIDLLVRLAQLVSDHPEISEFDLNPVIVHAGRAIVVDARLELRQPPKRPRATRRLDDS